MQGASIMSDNKQVTKPAATADADPTELELQRAMLPAVDVFEDAGGITLLADLPGVSREQLQVKVEGEALLLEGSMQPRAPDGLEAIYAEVRVPRYRRSFTLSRELDTTRIEANLKDGILTLRIPKQAHAQPQRITVNAG
jgi:HSP20 family molecular chaperone IbpA